MQKVSRFTCRSCGSEVEYLLDLGEHPIVNNLLAHPQEVRKFAMEIGGCRHCGLVQILQPIDPSEFYTNYATPSSVKREPHVQRLLDCLVSQLKNTAKIIDVGCGDGKFLTLLRTNGFNNLFGLEPTKNMSEAAINAGFKVFNTFLDESSADKILTETDKFDCLIIRQVLEHITDLTGFGIAIQNLLKPDGLLVIEVPDAGGNFSGPDYGLWEEHINYFTVNSLSIFLLQIGFAIIESYRSPFSGICLSVLSKKSTNNSDSKRNKLIDSKNSEDVLRFRTWSRKFSEFRTSINSEIMSFTEKGLQVVLYGVGSRSSPFMNITGTSNLLSFAIDDDIKKQGKYLPGSNIKILSRKDGLDLLKDNALVLLGVNGENEEKLLVELSSYTNLTFKSVLPPSKNLLSAFNL